ncbi:nitroreductase [Rubidibacter lacunae KORDI 51-2]|uniref:Nitroreductase n=1 Tax=Rubidibacter lacunae KORDI 51-2 TaxID=582515 RepID=U5DKE9_9CHRO|nr:nitroreductase family protein [Rubidibacter lacunae]ERN41392.1 nitroreductase [Rubidibacter lacunae KORDI 51-2]
MAEIYPSFGSIDAIEQRRSARAFTSDPIPTETLREILRLGTFAPSGFNLQPWRFIAVKNRANRKKLQSCAFDQRQVGEAPVVLICCGDRRATASENIEAVIALGRETGAIDDRYADFMRESVPQVFKTAPSFDSVEAWINRHVMLAVSQIMFSAKLFGIDSCPMEGFSGTRVKAAFNIPEDVDVCCLLALGYADEPFKEFGGRFPLEHICFGESYGEDVHL